MTVAHVFKQLAESRYLAAVFLLKDNETRRGKHSVWWGMMERIKLIQEIRCQRQWRCLVV